MWRARRAGPNVERRRIATHRLVVPILQDARAAARYIAAVVLGFLPRAFYPRLEGAFLPIHLASVPSAALEFLAGFAVGVPAFLVYAWRVANQNTDLMLAAANRRTPGGPEVTTAMSVGPSAFTLFTFVFFTPTGLISLYLASSGFVRLLSALLDEPFGDPLLSGLHRAFVHRKGRRDSALAATRRVALEGDDVPDRTMPGAEAGMPAAEVVIVSARRKPGWEQNVLVVTERGWFRIGRIFEEYHDGGLRTLYPLLRSPEGEVMRRAVTYDLPQEGDPSKEPDAEA